VSGQAAAVAPGRADRSQLSAHDPVDMLQLARESLEDWRQARGGSAAERRAARLLAWSVGRLDDMGALDRIAPRNSADAPR
jgi:hypothetical protein